MAFATLRFAEDIKGKRLCVAESMVDSEACNRLRPPRWRSSAALFAYKPPEEEQLYSDYLISHLTVVATITGYQPDGEEIGVPGDEWQGMPGIEEFQLRQGVLQAMRGPERSASRRSARTPQFPEIL